MSEEKQFENDPERTLITLEQLSQTIEVMTSVVNRLRQHLSEQLHAQMEAEQESVSATEEASTETAASTQDAAANAEQRASEARPAGPKESFVVEIRQQDGDADSTDGKILH